MVDKYIRYIEKDGTFLVGYHKNHATSAQNTYLSEGLRLVRVLSGEAMWRIGDQACLAQKNDILIFNNIVPRQIVDVPQSPMVYEVFGFSTSIFSFDPNYIHLFYGRTDTQKPFLPATHKSGQEIHAILDMIRQRMYEDDPSVPVITSLINAACAMIADAVTPAVSHCESPSLPTKDLCQAMGKAIRYINNNLSDLRDVSEIASHIHLSRGHFHKIFTQYTGYTPNYFINHCRMVRFMHLITTENITVLDAALKCGFESSSGFYKTFHRIYGAPPRDVLWKS